MAQNNNMYPPGLFKRLLIVIYDGLLLTAILIVTSAIVMGLFTFFAPDTFFIDPSKLDDHKVATLTQSARNIGGVLISLNCLAVSFLFYGWFWTHGGQTLGMRAWNLYLIKPDGKFIDWKIAGIRYVSAIVSWAAVGLGFTWILLDKKNRAWHDIASTSRILCVPKSPSKNK